MSHKSSTAQQQMGITLGEEVKEYYDKIISKENLQYQNAVISPETAEKAYKFLESLRTKPNADVKRIDLYQKKCIVLVEKSIDTGAAIYNLIEADFAIIPEALQTQGVNKTPETKTKIEGFQKKEKDNIVDAIIIDFVHKYSGWSRKSAIDSTTNPEVIEKINKASTKEDVDTIAGDFLKKGNFAGALNLILDLSSKLKLRTDNEAEVYFVEEFMPKFYNVPALSTKESKPIIGYHYNHYFSFGKRVEAKKQIIEMLKVDLSKKDRTITSETQEFAKQAASGAFGTDNLFKEIVGEVVKELKLNIKDVKYAPTTTKADMKVVANNLDTKKEKNDSKELTKEEREKLLEEVAGSIIKECISSIKVCGYIPIITQTKLTSKELETRVISGIMFSSTTEGLKLNLPTDIKWEVVNEEEVKAFLDLGKTGFIPVKASEVKKTIWMKDLEKDCITKLANNEDQGKVNKYFLDNISKVKDADIQSDSGKMTAFSLILNKFNEAKIDPSKAQDIAEKLEDTNIPANDPATEKKKKLEISAKEVIRKTIKEKGNVQNALKRFFKEQKVFPLYNNKEKELNIDRDRWIIEVQAETATTPIIMPEKTETSTTEVAPIIKLATDGGIAQETKDNISLILPIEDFDNKYPLLVKVADETTSFVKFKELIRNIANNKFTASTWDSKNSVSVAYSLYISHILDISDAQLWKTTHMVLKYFPGTVTEMRESA